jgi:hypothetical protein
VKWYRYFEDIIEHSVLVYICKFESTSRFATVYSKKSLGPINFFLSMYTDKSPSGTGMSNVKKTFSSFSPYGFLVCYLGKGTNLKLTDNFGYNSASSMFKPTHLRNILFPILICFSKIIFRSLSLTKAPQKIQWECLRFSTQSHRNHTTAKTHQQCYTQLPHIRWPTEGTVHL